MTSQLALFKEPYPPEPLPGHYLTLVGSLATVTRLPYREDVLRKIETVTGQGRFVPIGMIAEAVGVDFYSVLIPHLDHMESEGRLRVVNCYHGSEWPGPGQDYRGYYRLFQLCEEGAPCQQP